MSLFGTCWTKTTEDMMDMTDDLIRRQQQQQQYDAMVAAQPGQYQNAGSMGQSNGLNGSGSGISHAGAIYANNVATGQLGGSYPTTKSVRQLSATSLHRGEADIYVVLVSVDESARPSNVPAMASVDDLPHRLHDKAILLHAAVSDVIDEVVKIDGIGSVRKVGEGCWLYRIYE